jgi:hypothetical protein
LKEITCVNLRSKVSSFGYPNTILLLVATVTELKLIIVSKGEDATLKVEESAVQPFVHSGT